ncbi:MAG: PEGA domain-containing protein [Polyangiaceae bacterium]|nr:PEGA domain-containing protein [Polyangiaceae bacterium]
MRTPLAGTLRRGTLRALLLLLVLGALPVNPSQARDQVDALQRILKTSGARSLVAQAQGEPAEREGALELTAGARGGPRQAGALRWAPADDRLQARWVRGARGVRLRGAGVEVGLEREGAEPPAIRGAVLRQEGARGGSIWFQRGQEIEELVELPPGVREQRYHMELPHGYRLHQAAPWLLEVRDARGVARLRMAAREAWGVEGSRVQPRVEVRGGELRVEAGVGPGGGVLDPSWSAAGTLVLNRPEAGVIALPDGGLLLVGGDVLGSGVCETFDAETRLFTATGPLGAPRNNPGLHRRKDGKIVVFGGSDPVEGGWVKRVELYDPESRTFTDLGELDRPSSTFAPLLDGTVLLIGGEGEQATGLERWDPMTGERTGAGTLLQGRTRAGALALPGGEVLIVGGGEASFAEVYSPGTGQSVAVGELHENQERPLLTLLASGDALVGGPSLVERWSRTTGAFRVVDSSTITTGLHRLASGQVLKTGDESSVLFDPYSNQWEPLAGVAQLPKRLRFATLPTGHVLGVSGAAEQSVGAALLFQQEQGPGRSNDAEIVRLGRALSVMLQEGKVLMIQAEQQDSMLLPSSMNLTDGLETIRQPELLTGGAAVRLPSGRVIRVGGVQQDGTLEDRSWIFDPAQRRWHQGPRFSEQLNGHSALVLDDGRLLVAGGEPLAKSHRLLALWDEKTGVLTEQQLGLASIRAFGTATKLADGRVLFFGGTPETKPAEIFDPKTGISTPVGPAYPARYAHTATLLEDGSVLIAGGSVQRDATPYEKTQPEALRLDPTTLEATPLAMEPARLAHSATRLPDGRVLLMGGLILDDEGELQEGAPTQLFDPKTGAFTDTPGQLQTNHYNHQATVLPDGRVLLSGGFILTFNPIVGLELEIFDPATGTFSLPTATPSLLPSHAATAVLPSGLLLLAGGGSKETPSGGLLGLDPSSGEATLLPGLLQPPRTMASALLQEDGSVLIAGGEGQNGALKEVTRYDPAGQQLVARGPLSEGAVRPALARLPGGALIAGAASGVLERHDALQGSTVPVGKATSRVNLAATTLGTGDVLIAGGQQGEQPALPLEQVRPPAYTLTQRGTQPLGPRSWVLPGAEDSALVVGDNYIGALAAGGGLQFVGEVGLGVAAVSLPSGDRMVIGATPFNRCELFGPTGAPMGGCRRPPVNYFFQSADPRLHVTPEGRLVLLAEPFMSGLRHASIELLPRGVSRPVLAQWPSELTPGSVVTLQGARFRRVGAAGASNLAEVAGLHPDVLFRVDGGPPRLARVLESSDTSLTFEVPRSTFPGPGWLHVVTDGVPSEGRFTRLRPAEQGFACRFPSECASGFCVEGVCCDTSCEGTCLSCLAAQQGGEGKDGSCRAVALGLDPDNACEADGLECGKTGVCDGTGQCQIAPKGTPCFGGGTCDQGACLAPLPAVCDADGKTLAQPDGARIDCSPYACEGGACRESCEGDAQCIEGWWCSEQKDCRSCEGDAVTVGGVTLPCAPYNCERGACLGVCANDQDCSEGYRCTAGRCGPYCDEAGTSLVSPGSATSCAPYRCLQGACAVSCVTNLECAPGLLCGADGVCRAPAAPEEASGGCSHAGRGAPGGWWALALLALARRRRGAAALAALLGWRAVASGAEPPLEAAKEEFRKGVVLFEAGDVEVALEHFRRSRALFPSVKNTMNMAVSLDRLGRHDEALELFEEVLTRFNGELSPEERQQVPGLMAAMRARVGELELSSSANGELHVDGRRRAVLPLSTPLRLLAGRRKIRVIKEGHEPHEEEVEIRQGERVHVDVTLRVLTSAGRLRVEQDELPGAEVLIDGARVGELPWEGTLAPGPHVVQVLRGAVGSAPTLATVLQGQTTLLRLRVGPLAALSLRASLPSAQLRLGEVPLGRGSWQGSLPEGTHTLSASEEGYFPRSLSVELPLPSPAPIELTLLQDLAHPRWPRPPSLRPWVGIDLGGALGASLGSGVEGACGAGCSRSLPAGVVSLLTLGIELPLGLSLDLRGGYLAVGSAVERRLRRPLSTSAGDWSVDYDLRQDPSVRGPLAALGVSRGLALGDRWQLRGALALGVLFATSGDDARGSATSGGARANLLIPGASERLSSSPFVALLGLGVERRLGPFALQGALQALFVTGSGDPYNRGAVQVPPSCSPTAPTAVGCAPEALLLQDQRAHGPFALLLPTLGLRYTLGGSSP